MENVKNVTYGTHVTVIDKIIQEPVKLRVATYARVLVKSVSRFARNTQEDICRVCG